MDGCCVAFFVDHRENVTSVNFVLDERMFSDTVLRVTQLSPRVFLACDIRTLNGKTIADSLSYSERRVLLDELLGEFHSTDLCALLTYDEVPPLTAIRGWETYDDVPGSMGVFLPAEE